MRETGGEVKEGVGGRAGLLAVGIGGVSVLGVGCGEVLGRGIRVR